MQMVMVVVLVLMIPLHILQPVGIAFQDQLVRNFTRLLLQLRVYVVQVILVGLMEHYHQQLVL